MNARAGLVLSLLTAFVLGLLAFHPAARAFEALSAVACSSTGACTGGANASTGSGTIGSSARGNGVGGSTKNPVGTTHVDRAGVEGVDVSTDGQCCNAGVYGNSPNGQGVHGNSFKNIGVYGTSNNVGIYGISTGHSSETNVGIYGTSHEYGVYGTSENIGVGGVSSTGDGLLAQTDAVSGVGRYAIVAIANNGADLFLGSGANGSMFVHANGNIETTGLLYTGGSCINGCSRHRRVRSYGTSSATPTLEDAGESQLVAGSAYIRLDAKFAGAIDPREGYLVLITPEGDTNGVYVSQRSATGFLVRENRAGRSSAPFAYRIVAHPYGVHEARLPSVETGARPAPQLPSAPRVNGPGAH